MDAPARRRFDRLLEEVLRGLPPAVQALLEAVPLAVEDYPSSQIMREMRLEHRDELCGLFRGTPLTQRSVEQAAGAPDSIVLYREGIVATAVDDEGRILRKTIKDEIRKTILHELAHYHGIDEDELADLGYE